MYNFTSVNPVVAEIIITAAHIDNNRVRASLLTHYGLDLNDESLNAFLAESNIKITNKTSEEQEDIDQELDLILAYKRGDREAFDKLLIKYRDIIKRNVRGHFNKIEDIEDACSDATLVLAHALEVYDPEKAHVSFRYYAVKSIQNGLLEFKRLNHNVVLPETAVRACNKVITAANKLGIFFDEKKNFTNEMLDMLSEVTGFTPEKVIKTLSYMSLMNESGTLSYNSKNATCEDVESEYVECFVESNPERGDVEKRYVKEETFKIIHEAIDAVEAEDPTGVGILKELYGLDGVERIQRQEIAKKRKITAYELDLARNDAEEKIGLELIKRGFSYNFNENIDIFCA